VEFAVTAPLFIIILLGLIEMSRALDVTQRLSMAVREGGRAAASDIRDRIPPGTTLNQKITADIRNMLVAGGVNGNDITIAITHVDGPRQGQVFNLSDENNSLGYFQVRATVPYEKVGLFPSRIMKGKDLTATVIFRLGRNALSS